MTRIGFAYNQKPQPSAPSPIEEEGAGEDEPPSRRQDPPTRRLDSPARTSDLGGAATPSAPPDPDADQYAEWDTPDTIDAVARALETVGEVIRLEATADFPERLRAERPDIVFNIAEGLHGANREAHVPAICEFFGVAYSGSDPLTLALCLDKARTKEVLAYHAVPTAPFAVVREPADLAPSRFARQPIAAAGFPLFVKPLHEGSSKGITERNLCHSRVELASQVEYLLAHYAQPVLVEPYLPGREFTCAILGNGADATVLPIVGLRFDALPAGALPIYGYEAKWLWDRPDRPLEMFECPAAIDGALRATIEHVARRAYQVLGCRDWSRIDVRLDADGVPHVVEVNPLPGILPGAEDNSCFPKAARAAGIEYDELIRRCLLAAATRQHVALGAATLTASSAAAGRPASRSHPRPSARALTTGRRSARRRP